MKATDAIIKLLHEQKLEITKLISMFLVTNVFNTGHDKGTLNDLTRAMKINEEIEKKLKEWES